MVGATEFESATSSMSTMRSNQLSYAPKILCNSLNLSWMRIHKEGLDKFCYIFASQRGAILAICFPCCKPFSKNNIKLMLLCLLNQHAAFNLNDCQRFIRCLVSVIGG